MDATGKPSLWDELDPRWMFRCGPEDFRWPGESICPGIFWMPGMFGLLTLHAGAVHAVWVLWPVSGAWALLAPLPLLPLWVLFVAADVKFRRRKPDRRERRRFDEAVVNWFGWVLARTGLAWLVLVAQVAYIGW